MLTLTFEETEYYNSDKDELGQVQRKQTVCFEHSLISLRKWESKWCKPFLGSEKTDEETIDYIRCMTISQNVDPNIYEAMIFGEYTSQLDQILKYIDAPMSAAKFYTIGEKEESKISNETVTAETIYYWMLSYQIPVEFQKWHINSLMALIRFISVKNSKDNKLSDTELASYMRAQNAARRKALGSKG